MRYVLEVLIQAGFYIGVFWSFLTLCGLVVLALVMFYYWLMGDK